MSANSKGVNYIWHSLTPFLHAKLHLLDGQAPVWQMKHAPWRVSNAAAELSDVLLHKWETGKMRKKELVGRKRQNKWFIWSRVNIYTFSLRLPLSSNLPRETHYFPPVILSCNRTLSGFFSSLFHSISLTSCLETHSLCYSAQLQREQRGVRSFLWDSAGWGRERALLAIERICTLF